MKLVTPGFTPDQKPRTDWESIEKQFRAGLLSIREIAAAAGLSEGAIRKKAKLNGWERDLTAKVAAQVRSDLVRTEVRAKDDTNKVRTEREVVQQAAASVVEVIRSHRTYLANAWRIADVLRDQLMDTIENRMAIESEVIEATPGNAAAGRRYRMLAAVSLASNVSTLKDLSVAIKSIVGLERQAFGMSDGDDGAPPAPSVEVDRRIEFERNASLEDKLRAALAAA